MAYQKNGAIFWATLYSITSILDTILPVDLHKHATHGPA